MSAITQRIDFDAIDKRAAEVRPGLVLVHIIGTVIWAIAWAVTRLLGYLFFGFIWMLMAVEQGAVEGWKDTPTAKVMAMRRQAAEARRQAA